MSASCNLDMYFHLIFTTNNCGVSIDNKLKFKEVQGRNILHVEFNVISIKLPLFPPHLDEQK